MKETPKTENKEKDAEPEESPKETAKGKTKGKNKEEDQKPPTKKRKTGQQVPNKDSPPQASTSEAAAASQIVQTVLENLQRANTMDTENKAAAEKAKEAIRKEYKARKARFYRSLISPGL